MGSYDHQQTRRAFCTHAAALPAASLSATGSVSPFRPDPTLQWQFAAPDADGLLPTATDGNHVFASATNATAALDIDDGTEQWRYEGARPAVLPQRVGSEHVYTITTDEDGFTALDRMTGEPRWQSSVAGLPVASQGTVFVGGESLHAYDAADGTTRWTFDMPGGVTGLVPSTEGVYVAGTGRLHAVERVSGSERWAFEIPDSSKYRYLYPVQTDTETSTILVWDYRQRTLRSFSTVDGSERWHHEFDNDQNHFEGVIGGRSALVVEGSDVVAVALEDGTTRWRFGAGEQLSPQLQLIDSESAVVARSNHHVYCISLEDGAAAWTAETNGRIYAVGADEDVTVTTVHSEAGRRRIVRLSGLNGSLLWIFETRSESLRTLTVNGQVYAGTTSDLQKLVARSGSIARAERLLSNAPVGLLAGVVGIGGVIGGAYHALAN